MADVEAGEKGAPHSQRPLMYGNCSNDPAERSQLRQRSAKLQHSSQSCNKKLEKACNSRWRKFLIWHLGEEWIVLILLGFIPAFFSWVMDFGIDFGLESTRWLYKKAHNVFLQYLAWVSIPVLLIVFSAAFTSFVGPQAAGSGIPEMKTIVKGVKVHRHVGLRTLVAKLVGLTCALGSGMPLGKESPFVHVGGICAAQLNRLMAYVSGIKQSESQGIELMIVGCAVGIAACFGSPIGGILYSIEVASSIFMVRSYWKGYFAATISAFVFRALPVWSGYNETITPLFKTWFRRDFPYEMNEMLSFTILGVLSGLAGAFFVFLNAVMVRFIRSPRRISKFLVKTRVLYPAIVTLVIATLTFPPGLGQFMAGKLTQRETLLALFDNHTWSRHLENEHFDHHDHSEAWKHPQVSVFVTLTISFIAKLFMSAVAISMPVPCGAFVPAFVVGAGLGRLVGELTEVVLPKGLYANRTTYTVVPGSYAVAGAAAMSGAATHTISTAVIVFELTGQINFLFPMIFSVIVANIVAQCLQPSLYDSLIRIRKLPFPVEPNWDHPENSDVQVEEIMDKNLRYITLNSTYRDIHNFLLTELKVLPLVKSAESMILLGSIERSQLQLLLSKQLDCPRRLEYLQKQGQNSDNQRVLQEDGPSCSTAHSFTSKPQEKSTRRVSQDSEITLKSLLCTHSTVATTEEQPEEETMTPKEIIEWEEQQLDEKVNFDNCKTDPASVQIVAHTSLPKVHSIFSMMGLDLAYVTSVGRLIGVVSRQELHKAMESFVKERGAETHPPMASFRESMTRLRKTATPEARELSQLMGSLDQLTNNDGK